MSTSLIQSTDREISIKIVQNFSLFERAYPAAVVERLPSGVQ